MLSQKDAVYQATMAVLKRNNVEFKDGQNVRDAIKDNLRLRSEIRNLVFQGLRTGKVAFGGSEDERDDRTLRTYATGLISNWFRKDRRLNGGGRYIPATTREDRHVSAGERKIRQLQAAVDVTDDKDLKKRLEEAIDDIKEQEAQLPEESIEEHEGLPPSYGSGHRGAVIDPEHDRRLKRNESTELHRARQEAGHKGGTTVAQERGSEFYSQIGQKGGLSRGDSGRHVGSEEDRRKGAGEEVVYSKEEEQDIFRDVTSRKQA